MRKIHSNLQLISIAAALALSCAATNASADGYLDSKIKDAPELWAGPYFGIYFGGGAGNGGSASYDQVINLTSITTLVASGAIVSKTTTNTTVSGNPATNRDTSGSVADLLVGYNYHRNNSKFLVGAQLEGSVFSDIKTKAGYITTSVSRVSNNLNGITTTNTTRPTMSSRYDLSSMLSIIGRAGFIARPDTMIYGLVGPTEGHFVIPDGFDSNQFNKSQWTVGLSSGAGLEHKFNENWSVIAEYRYIYFNLDNSKGNTNQPTESNNGSAVTVTTSNIVTTWKTNFDMNIGKIGIVFRC
jgi:opacity protein-like surface antigen